MLFYFFVFAVDPSRRNNFLRFLKKAEQGDVEAQYQLGAAYHEGVGVIRNFKEALIWYTKAAGFGHVIAQHQLGGFYAFGTGVSKDPNLAINWYQKAVAQGWGLSAVSLGCIYSEDKGVPVDLVEAHAWFTVGVALGADQYGCMLLKEIEKYMAPEKIVDAALRAHELRSALPKNTDDLRRDLLLKLEMKSLA